MASHNNSSSATDEAQSSYFHSQRAMLVSEIAQSMDSVLTNLNRLNRSMEAIIAVGNEFSNVEALWSTFEGVMGDQPTETTDNKESNTAEGAAVDEDKIE
ncbi:hypothetical protein BT63DRAFT_476610 [Microthyrium microscopicum]|uniref:DASH complex subunit DAD1 n=1 Tax=Microthyrium microscopicum TaxID=703497 RepID=A0A6A6UIY6_9PEZI|nr:hypothetical protein BT63DRAFT_476610 [Microthyrium microscopicum]